MAWKETCVMNERTRFMAAVISGAENMSDLCRQFGISRKTGYKLLRRYEAHGPEGLRDRSRAPLSNSRAIDEALIEPIVALRRCYPSWGPRKLKAWLEDARDETAWPAASTIGRILDSHEEAWLVKYATLPLGTIKGKAGLQKLANRGCGLVDKPSGLPTTPQPQQQQDSD